MIQAHALNRGPTGIISPADNLEQPVHVDIGSDNRCSAKTLATESACGHPASRCRSRMVIGIARQFPGDYRKLSYWRWQYQAGPKDKGLSQVDSLSNSFRED